MEGAFAWQLAMYTATPQREIGQNSALAQARPQMPCINTSSCTCTNLARYYSLWTVYVFVVIHDIIITGCDSVVKYAYCDRL